jgi:hypothetical protein
MRSLGNEPPWNPVEIERKVLGVDQVEELSWVKLKVITAV